MKILIIENETYLARSIASKLEYNGFSCDLADFNANLFQEKRYDIILLSTSINGLNFNKIIKDYSNSIIILLINHISNDVISALRAGANDYILKPIIIEELIRKIDFFVDFQRYKTLNSSYEKILKIFYNNFELSKINHNMIKFPLFLISNNQEICDYFVIKTAKMLEFSFEIFDGDDKQIYEFLSKPKGKNIIYIKNFDNLNEEKKEKLLLNLGKNIVIISSKNKVSDNFHQIELENSTTCINNNEIITIDDYVKSVILNWQDSVSDTNLAKNLGISRKSLWEKRRRYGIIKKK